MMSTCGGVKLMEYKYYFIVEKETNELFAYSDNKTYVDEFKNSRDMRKFNVVKQYISRAIVNKLAADIPKKYLVCKELPTKPKGKKISIILTQYEYEGIICMGNDIFFNKVIEKYKYPCEAFNEICKMLDSIDAENLECKYRKYFRR